MKLRCSISGISYTASNYEIIRNSIYGAIHPVCLLPFPKLEKIHNDFFQRNRLDNNEIKLLSIALLNSTNRVEFNCSISFPEYSIKSALIAIPELIAINSLIHNGGLSENSINRIFPIIIISKDNDNYHNEILDIIKLWKANIDEYNNGISSYKFQKIRAAQNEQLDALLAAYSKRYRKPRKFLVMLSDYILESLDIPDNRIMNHIKTGMTLKDYYKYIIQYSGNVDSDIFPYLYPIDFNSINDLIELIQSQLDFDNIYVFHALELLNSLINSGIYNKYGMNVIIKNNQDNHNNTPKIPAPVRSDYHDYNSYFLAYTQYIANNTK